MSQYKVDVKGTIKRKQDKANPEDKSIHLFKGFNEVLRSRFIGTLSTVSSDIAIKLFTACKVAVYFYIDVKTWVFCFY